MNNKIEKNKRINVLKFYKYTSAILAFILWSVWAYFINIESDNNIISALTQGVSSFLITLIMIKLIEFFYDLFPKNRWFFILPSIVTVGLTSSFVVFIHVLIDTKNIFFTVLPTVIISFLFALYTTKKLKRIV